MINFHPNIQQKSRTVLCLKSYHQSWKILAHLAFLIFLTSGCAVSPSLGLKTHFENEPNASAIIKGKLASQAENRIPASMVIVFNTDSASSSLGFTEDTWPQFAARVKHEVQDQLPVSMQEVIRLDAIPSGERFASLQTLGEKHHLDVVLVVLSASQEIKGPAQFNVLPEVGTLNGHQVENHASVELGLLDLKSGKLLLRSQGTSHAILEQLDVPLASNRYPRVRGSAITSSIYPAEDKALDTLRTVALQEALDQAVFYLHREWKDAG